MAAGESIDIWLRGIPAVMWSGGVFVGKGKGYNHMHVANTMPSQNRAWLVVTNLQLTCYGHSMNAFCVTFV